MYQWSTHGWKRDHIPILGYLCHIVCIYDKAMKIYLPLDLRIVQNVYPNFKKAEYATNLYSLYYYYIPTKIIIKVVLKFPSPEN